MVGLNEVCVLYFCGEIIDCGCDGVVKVIVDVIVEVDWVVMNDSGDEGMLV